MEENKEFIEDEFDIDDNLEIESINNQNTIRNEA
jgi:hypothetical protein